MLHPWLLTAFSSQEDALGKLHKQGRARVSRMEAPEIRTGGPVKVIWCTPLRQGAQEMGWCPPTSLAVGGSKAHRKFPKSQSLLSAFVSTYLPLGWGRCPF